MYKVEDVYNLTNPIKIQEIKTISNINI